MRPPDILFLIVALHYAQFCPVSQLAREAGDEAEDERGDPAWVWVVRPGALQGQDSLHSPVVGRVVQLLQRRDREELAVVLLAVEETVSAVSLGFSTIKAISGLWYCTQHTGFKRTHPWLNWREGTNSFHFTDRANNLAGVWAWLDWKHFSLNVMQ